MKGTLLWPFPTVYRLVQNHRTVHSSTLHDAQFPFRNGEAREAAIQADKKLWKDPDDGLVQTGDSGEMDGNFSVEIALVLRLARFARHFSAL